MRAAPLPLPPSAAASCVPPGALHTFAAASDSSLCHCTSRQVWGQGRVQHTYTWRSCALLGLGFATSVVSKCGDGRRERRSQGVQPPSAGLLSGSRGCNVHGPPMPSRVCVKSAFLPVLARCCACSRRGVPVWGGCQLGGGSGRKADAPRRQRWAQDAGQVRAMASACCAHTSVYQYELARAILCVCVRERVSARVVARLRQCYQWAHTGGCAGVCQGWRASPPGLLPCVPVLPLSI